MQHCANGRCAALAVALALLPAGLFSAQANASQRTISLYNIHTNKKLTVTFRQNGHYVHEALKKLNYFLRDFRRNEVIEMDPDLINLAWEIHRELGSKEPIQVISGYRSPATNAMLRRTRGGQAKRSQHMLGRAMDMQFPDIPIHRLRYSALIRQRGGVGYYPTSAIPFVHIDTARVRHWPRMNRDELALLFPSGRTLHRPASGGPITRADVIHARKVHPQLYRRVAAFYAERQPLNGRRTVVAAASPRLPTSPFRTSVQPQLRPPAPKLAIRPPALVNPPSPARRPNVIAAALHTPGPSLQDRNRLMQLATLASVGGFALPNPFASPATSAPATAPKPPVENVWVRAPSFDEEHPEELSYRPFPILPLLTDGPTDNHSILTRLVHPDPARTIALIDEADDLPQMRLRPGRQLAQMLWAQAFSGSAIALETMVAARQPSDGQPNKTPSGWNERRILTSLR